MKRFATVLAICAALFTGYGVYAIDFIYDGGGAEGVWADKDNWNLTGNETFPGGASGAPRVIDRAEYSDGVDAILIFEAGSGAGNCVCRTIVEFFLDADTANAELTLQVTGATLNIDQFFMISDDTANRPAKLVMDGGELNINQLDITGTTNSPAALEISADVTVAADTQITGVVNLTMVDAVMDFGRLVITNGKIQPPPA